MSGKSNVVAIVVSLLNPYRTTYGELSSDLLISPYRPSLVVANDDYKVSTIAAR